MCTHSRPYMKTCAHARAHTHTHTRAPTKTPGYYFPDLASISIPSGHLGDICLTVSISLQLNPLSLFPVGALDGGKR